MLRAGGGNTSGGSAITGTTITATTKFVAPAGTVGAPSIIFSATNTGFWEVSSGNISVSTGGTERFRFGSGGIFSVLAGINLGTSIAVPDVLLVADAANTLAQKNAASAQTFRIYGTTTGPKYLSLSHDGTNGVIDTAASSGLIQIAPTNATSVAVGKPFTAIGGITTVGAVGAPAIVATGRATAQNAANASVSTFTVGAADASFEVSANVLVTTATTHNFTVTCAYTDEGNTGRTLTLTFSALAGTLATTIVNTGGTVPYEGVPLHIRCKASTSITIATTGTFTTVVYNVEGIIRQLA